jgi:hypothetical protein
MSEMQKKRQLLHLVLGGELRNLNGREFRDPDKIDIVGIFPDYASAQAAWKAKAQATVDNALQCYCIVDLSSILCSKVNMTRQELS